MNIRWIIGLVSISIVGLFCKSLKIDSASAEVVAPVYDDAVMRAARAYENNFLRRRNLIALPMTSVYNGPSGSFHYNPDSSSAPPTDVYINPDTSCAFQNVLKEWSEKSCPDKTDPNIPYEERGCRVAFGNISTRNSVNFPPHQTHKHGDCIDIRPMRKGAFTNAGLTYGASQYDAKMTADFIKMAKENGASLVLFNDPNIRSRPRSSTYVPGVVYSQGHDNHMHICFNPRSLTPTQKTCPKAEQNEKAEENDKIASIEEYL